MGAVAAARDSGSSCAANENLCYTAFRRMPQRPRVSGLLPCCYSTFSMVFVRDDGSRFMKQPSFQSIAQILLIPLLSGCQYDRSFMHMDSNSGVPFFGLQLAVDSGSRPPRKESETTAPENPLRVEHHRVESLSARRPDTDTFPPRMTLVSQNEVAGRPSLELTSRTASFNGRVLYSIPQQSREHRSIAERVDLRRAAF